MAAGNDALWQSVCKVVGREDLLADERYASPTLRARHQAELRDTLEEVFGTRSAAHWIERFREAGVPCAPINTYSQVLADPQVEHMQWVQPLQLPNGVRTRTFVSPVRVDGRTLPVRLPPPALGEHNAQLLQRAPGEATE